MSSSIVHKTILVQIFKTTRSYKLFASSKHFQLKYIWLAIIRRKITRTCRDVKTNKISVKSKTTKGRNI